MNPTTNRPLWEVMQAAYFKGRNPGISEPHGYAAELRAIAEEIERRDDQGLNREPGRIAQWLHAEADRAEARLAQPAPEPRARPLIFRCVGVGRHPCVGCLRRTAPMRDQPTRYMLPPEFTTTCPERIAP